LLFDDEIDSGRSACNAARLLADVGAVSIDFFTIYDFAREGAFDRLAVMPRMSGIYRTNASLRSPLGALPVPSRTFDLSPLLGELYQVVGTPEVDRHAVSALFPEAARSRIASG
jgi:phosphoribosylpyrophosphate synthetase